MQWLLWNNAADGRLVDTPLGQFSDNDFHVPVGPSVGWEPLGPFGPRFLVMPSPWGRAPFDIYHISPPCRWTTRRPTIILSKAIRVANDPQ